MSTCRKHKISDPNRDCGCAKERAPDFIMLHANTEVLATTRSGMADTKKVSMFDQAIDQYQQSASASTGQVSDNLASS
jgi:hypothetical protein